VKTKTILTTCVGAMWLAKSGVLDGKRATTNRVVLGSASKMSKVNWLDQRWVIEDGHFEGAQIWTAGGAGCGKLFGLP
jgi:putative intracellular protease/amidase